MSDTLSPDVEAAIETFGNMRWHRGVADRIDEERDRRGLPPIPYDYPTPDEGKADIRAVIQQAIAEAVRHEIEGLKSQVVVMCEDWNAFWIKEAARSTNPKYQANGSGHASAYRHMANLVAAITPTGIPSVASEGPDTKEGT